jgi:type II secretory pathway pseudopilin PulG
MPMQHRRGITLMETVIGALLVGGVVASTLQIVAPTVRATKLAEDRKTAAALADEMLDEIAAHPFADPTDPTSTNGPEAGETTGTRKAFDDVDDYHGWNTTPQQPDGTALPGIGAGWTLRIGVSHVRPNNPTQVVAADTGVKHVIIQVRRNGTLLAERSMLRTRAFDATRDPA